MITKIAPMQTPIKAYNNNKAPAFGKLDIDNSFFLPYISKHFTETDKSFNERIILDDFNHAKNKFMPDIKKLENKEIDMYIKGIDYRNAVGGTGFLSYISDKKTGTTHLFAQRYDAYDAYDDSLLALSMRPTPFTVIYKTVEKAFEVLNTRK